MRNSPPPPKPSARPVPLDHCTAPLVLSVVHPSASPRKATTILCPRLYSSQLPSLSLRCMSLSVFSVVRVTAVGSADEAHPPAATPAYHGGQHRWRRRAGSNRREHRQLFRCEACGAARPVRPPPPRQRPLRCRQRRPVHRSRTVDAGKHTGHGCASAVGGVVIVRLRDVVSQPVSRWLGCRRPDVGRRGVQAASPSAAPNVRKQSPAEETGARVVQRR